MMVLVLLLTIKYSEIKSQFSEDDTLFVHVTIYPQETVSSSMITMFPDRVKVVSEKTGKIPSFVSFYYDCLPVRSL